MNLKYLLYKINEIFIIFWDKLVSILSLLSFRFFSKTLISFTLIGIFGLIFQINATNLFLEILDLSLNLSIVLSTISSVSFAFLLNNFLTFKENKLVGKNLIKGFLKNIFFNIIIILARSLLAIIFIKFFLVKISISQIYAIIICFAWRYLVSKKFIWKISNKNTNKNLVIHSKPQKFK